ncbi:MULTISPECIES: hypothetical protein [Vibrio]|uniref:hypothetical protein n=1 Tax=Vibrio TaxID=662 RepID=UPI00030A18B3|nr:MULTISPECIES: hypothetical protein [Vibrio]KHT50282.1 hypothetical protein RJ46_05230 [Vibrio sinaloensis]CAK4074494.1 hypothetical protein VDT1_3437 [Vibrio sp. 16]
MKHFALAFATTLTLAGCSSNDINDAVSDGVNGAINGVLGSVSSSNGTVVKNGKSYSVEKERMYTTQATRLKKNYGNIELTRTEKNPKSKTELVLESCVHPRIGSIGCEGYIFEVTKEGWLVEKPITFNTNYNKDISIASGTYYFKMTSKGTGDSYYVANEITIQPFVTNYVALTVE